VAVISSECPGKHSQVDISIQDMGEFITIKTICLICGKTLYEYDLPKNKEIKEDD